jgi:hypothetical protein
MITHRTKQVKIEEEGTHENETTTEEEKNCHIINNTNFFDPGQRSFYWWQFPVHLFPPYKYI